LIGLLWHGEENPLLAPEREELWRRREKGTRHQQHTSGQPQQWGKAAPQGREKIDRFRNEACQSPSPSLYQNNMTADVTMGQLSCFLAQGKRRIGD
jgi:hypothetical protein